MFSLNYSRPSTVILHQEFILLILFFLANMKFELEFFMKQGLVLGCIVYIRCKLCGICGLGFHVGPIPFTLRVLCHVVVPQIFVSH